MYSMFIVHQSGVAVLIAMLVVVVMVTESDVIFLGLLGAQETCPNCSVACRSLQM